MLTNPFVICPFRQHCLAVISIFCASSFASTDYLDRPPLINYSPERPVGLGWREMLAQRAPGLSYFLREDICADLPQMAAKTTSPDDSLLCQALEFDEPNEVLGERGSSHDDDTNAASMFSFNVQW